MRARMRTSIFVLVVLCCFAISQPVFADSLDPELNAHFRPGNDGQSVNLTTSVGLPVAHQGAGSAGSTTVSPYRVGPFYWTAQPSVYIRDDRGAEDIDHDVFLHMPCNPATFVGTGEGYAPDDERSGEGEIYMGMKIERSTGVGVYEKLYCKPNHVSASTAPANVSMPPSYGAIWNSIYSEGFSDDSISSGAYVAPASPGLTQLPTHIWSEFPQGQSITRTVSFAGGYQLRATAEIAEVSIIAKSPKGNVKTIARAKPNLAGYIDGGSFDHPLAIYHFVSKGTYVITTGIIWTAENVTLSGPDIGSVSVPIGSIRLEINREYEVEELRPGITK